MAVPSPDPDPADGRRRRRRQVLVVPVVAGVLVAALLIGLGARGAGGSQVGAVTVGDTACAPQWRATHSGRHVYRVTDDGPSPEEVSIVGPNHLTTYAELEMLAPGTTLPMVAILPPGRYSWACEGDNGEAGYSDEELVTGPPVAGASPFIPVTYDQLSGAVELYRASVTKGLTALQAATTKLLVEVRRDPIATVESQWLTAELDFDRLGAAYDTFGPYDDEIDGRPNGLVGGTANPQWTGFLRLEYGLWHGQGRPELVSVTTTLSEDVNGLVRAFPSQATDPNDIALRTHEILENALQFELTGETDQGSHTNLATVYANVQGTEMTLASLRPLLGLVDPSLYPQLESGLVSLGRLVVGYDRDGRWTPLQALGTSPREQLDGAVSGLLEQLSVLPDRMDILLTHDNTN